MSKAHFYADVHLSAVTFNGVTKITPLREPDFHGVPRSQVLYRTYTHKETEAFIAGFRAGQGLDPDGSIDK